jgi:FtsZ-interacting cell division protein ZipA
MTQKSRTIVVFAVILIALVIVFLWNRYEREHAAEPAPPTSR